jgi:hypothetical protein
VPAISDVCAGFVDSSQGSVGDRSVGVPAAVWLDTSTASGISRGYELILVSLWPAVTKSV